MSENTAQQIEFKKNNFYRDQYRRTIKFLLLNGFIAIGLVLVLGYLLLFPGQPKYYATTTNGEVIQLHALSEPVVTNNYIIQWASIATRTALNIGYVRYKTQLLAAKPNFTPDGWMQFMRALNTSGLLKTVLNEKVIMSAVVSGAPVVLNRAVLHGRYTWRIQMPVLVTFESASENKQTKLIVTMNVQRVPTLNAAKGIQISDFRAVEPV